MRHSLSGQIINWKGWFWRSGEAPNPLNLVKSCPCEFWFDGADASTISLNGNKVIQWDDKSGNARHVANVVDARRPTYSAVTGRLTFVAANNTYLQLANFAAPLAQPNTIYVLYKITGALGDTEGIFDGTVVNSQNLFYYAGNTFNLFAAVGLIGGATNANDNIHAAEFNVLVSNYWINGVLVAGPGNTGANPLDGITIGATRTLASPADAEIMEVFGYNCILTNPEHSNLFDYINNKWSLGYVNP